MLVTFLAGVLVVLAVLFIGDLRWRGRVNSLEAELDQARRPHEPTRYDQRELGGLPSPVQRYLRLVMTDGQPIAVSVRLKQTGTMNLGETAGPWKTFTAGQRVVTRRPGFVWDARIALWPGVAVRVLDGCVAGEGVLQAAVLGLFTQASLRGPGELARGELIRFLAEAPWYPTALLPSQGVRWAEVDGQSARGTLRDGDISVSLLFRFGPDGLISSVRAEARGRISGGVTGLAPWEGRFWNYSRRGGMQVPLNGEVAWILAGETKPYWRGKVTHLAHEFAT